MSIQYTVIGDPHLTLKSYSKIQQLHKTVESYGKPAIWLGDLLDTKEIIRGTCLNLWLNYFSESKLEHIILVGNHDWFNLECEDHALAALKHFPNVKVIDSIQEIDGMYFIPYIRDQDELKKVLKSIPKDSILFGHLEIASFDFGNGHICENGLNTRSINKFKRVISGHFHKYQEKGNLVYLGTPFSHTFGESNQDKYLGFYTPSTDTLELISTEFPQHITYTVDCDTPGQQEFTHKPQDLVRIILAGTQANIDAYRIANNLEGLKVIERASDDIVSDAVIEDTLDNATQFSKWAKEIKALDAETIKLGLEILGACNAK